MQLKPAPIRARMGVATCALLQAGAHAGGSEGWDIDTAVLIYSEADSRIAALEPAIHASKQLNNDNNIDLQFVVDVLTGATPNGAHASSVAQTFTTPSGSGSYTVAAGDTPLDTTFRDLRYAANATWERTLDRLTRVTLGASLSSESDYQSAGVNANLIRDFNHRNTSLTVGIAYNSDTVKRNAGEGEDEGGASLFVRTGGGTPVPFSPMLAPVTLPGGIIPPNPDGKKNVAELMLGVTQVINQNTLIQLNLAASQTNGYQTDPYKLLSVVNPLTGLPDNTALLNINVSALPYVYEKRPDKRQRNSLFFKGVHSFGEDVLHLSYRYYWDDWGIISHTLDMRYRYQMQASYLQPRIRYYTQTEADFYRHHLIQGIDVDANGNVLVDYASHDYRLASSDTITLGLKYGYPLSSDSELGLRVELITQTVDNSGIPAGEETPDLNATVLQANYNLVW